MTAPARTEAYRALRAIEIGRVDLPAALAEGRARLRDERDRDLMGEIVTGTLRWQRSLDLLVVQASGRALDRLDPEVLTLLRLSLYQLLHLDRVPAAAIVHDAVDLVRAARKPSATGFVNAVLRTVQRTRHRLEWPERPTDPLDRPAALAYLGVRYSHPDWLVERWLDRYGLDDTERWVRFDNETPPVCLRVNRLRATREEVITRLAGAGVTAVPAVYAPDGLIVTDGRVREASVDGAALVQDEASQLVTLVVAARPGMRVLDVCAAPGGKTTAMAADMDDQGLVVACDVRPRRVALLRRTVSLAGAGRVRIVQIAPRGPLPFSTLFDRILVDAPCSGLGTLRRDPDIRWRRTAADLPAYAATQRDLLARAVDRLAPGGRLVYATCSSEPEENEGVVDAVLAERSDLECIDLRADGDPRLAPLLDDRGFLRTLPWAHGLEAFFAAALVRRVVG